MTELENIVQLKEQEQTYKKRLQRQYPFISEDNINNIWSAEWNNTYSILNSMEHNNEYGMRFFIEHYKYKMELVYGVLTDKLELNPQQLSFEWQE